MQLQTVVEKNFFSPLVCRNKMKFKPIRPEQNFDLNVYPLLASFVCASECTPLNTELNKKKYLQVSTLASC